MIVGQAFGHQPDDPVPIPPRPLDHLICRTVEVEAVDVSGLDDVSSGRAEGGTGYCGRRLLCQPNTRREVRGHLRFGLIRKCPPAQQAAIRDQSFAVADE